ncbi:PREDICTED: cyclin-H-like [Priapulus caudatus]|uniref:Cyclin-H n=1 Tax=Priapulus caudatus TaxID=37621 RepID=A0ABM1F4K2_PRICU|nr:PREDICTED: cyclin-H-like [Priapulus caudatus]XP_014679374.1 PREDICTED: cyclin-H-like [Priapulus caudatus]XP_014679375.1 PREDICTED: cyclin-H-like [Priapulus caudatus]
MFATSTQVKHWIFSSPDELHKCRELANSKFSESHGGAQSHFLQVNEERMLCRHFENVMKEFCVKFQPPMPRNTIATSFAYFKRFFLHNSVMNYHPKHIMLTAVYLACKTEEFNISVAQYVANLPGKREKAADLVLSNELLLMGKLNYQLTVHHPWRPLEGFLIDMKTRLDISDKTVEGFRKGAEDFLDGSLLSEVSLLFPPSHIALAAVVYSAQKQGIQLTSYISDILLASADDAQKGKVLGAVKEVIAVVGNVDRLQRDKVKQIEKKLEICRNQNNNPESSAFKKRKDRELKDDDRRREQKYARQAAQEKREQAQVCGIVDVSK